MSKGKAEYLRHAQLSLDDSIVHHNQDMETTQVFVKEVHIVYSTSEWRPGKSRDEKPERGS